MKHLQLSAGPTWKRNWRKWKRFESVGGHNAFQGEKYLLEYKKFSFTQTLPAFTREFKDGLDKVLSGIIRSGHSDRNSLVTFAEKWPQYLPDEKERLWIRKKVEIQQHNAGVTKALVSDRHRFFLLVWYFQEIVDLMRKKFGEEPKLFFDWYDNYDMELYRGTRGKPISMTVKGGSFSMDEQVAVRFTQSEWLAFSMENKKDRNGFVSVTVVKPRDILCFTNIGKEFEAILPSPVRLDAVFAVERGEFLQEPVMQSK